MKKSLYGFILKGQTVYRDYFESESEAGMICYDLAEALTADGQTACNDDIIIKKLSD